MTEMQALSVSQLNHYIKSVMDGDRLLGGVFVRGEISNYKRYPSGHHYFSLKDSEGSLRCVMFRGDAAKLRFLPENGMTVVAMGRVTVFPRDGQYQLYCSGLQQDGVGELHAAFEQLKRKLDAQGLFSVERKRPLPEYPNKIALITSPAGAAVRDMLRILKERWPVSEVVLIPTSVQGADAPEEICRAFSLLPCCEGVELVITGRGGGSMEDLWCFNDERVANAIAQCPVPVISAVGHEPDITIADLVADLRAATPSNGAELATPDVEEVRTALRNLEGRLKGACHRRLAREGERLRRLGGSRVLRDPRIFIEEKRQILDRQYERLSGGVSLRLERERSRLIRLAATLDAVSPMKVLGRGYSIPRTQEGAVIRSVKQTAPGDRLFFRLEDGELDCKVEGVMPHGRKKAKF